MPYIYGQLLFAQLENSTGVPAAGGTPTGRMYIDVSIPSASVPYFYNGTGWQSFASTASPTFTGTVTTPAITVTGIVGPGGVRANASGVLSLTPIPTYSIKLTGTNATYTVPVGCTWIKIRMVGGGGGGAAGGSTFNTTATGGAGGQTSFVNGTAPSLTLTCGGGAGGTCSANPAIGGTASGENIIGIAGASGGATSNVSTNFGQSGGSTPFGGAGGGGGNGQNGAAAAANSGSGGGGGGLSGSGVSGGGGAAGAYLEHAMAVTPGLTYTFNIGGSGAAGVLTSYQSGGAGGSGMIIIEEHYG